MAEKAALRTVRNRHDYRLPHLYGNEETNTLGLSLTSNGETTMGGQTKKSLQTTVTQTKGYTMYKGCKSLLQTFMGRKPEQV